MKNQQDKGVVKFPSESQTIEYKESWRDEYLKWICGFANAQGGTLYIGINDDKEIVGVADSKRLAEEIPNKVRDLLGIFVDVNVRNADEKEYLEIFVPAYSNPINYKGQYHYRSGSTKQELKGLALSHFLEKRNGLHWDQYAVPNVSIDDLYAKHSSQAFNVSVAHAFFRSGDIEAWGRGYRRIAKFTQQAKLLPPIIKQDNGLMITYFNNAELQLRGQGYDERQIKVIAYVIERGQITNTNVQEMFKISRVTALRILSSLDKYLELIGGKGTDSHYVMKRF